MGPAKRAWASVDGTGKLGKLHVACEAEGLKENHGVRHNEARGLPSGRPRLREYNKLSQITYFLITYK